MKIYTTENDDYSIKQCSNKCATFCYNEDDEQSCACMSDSLFEYLIESDQKGQSRTPQLQASVRHRSEQATEASVYVLIIIRRAECQTIELISLFIN